VAITHFKLLSSEKIIINEIEIELQRKRMKYLRIRILGSDGQVRVSAPKSVSIEFITSFITSRIPWIKEQQNKIRSKVRPQPLQYISGEHHNFFGKKYLLELAEQGRTKIDFDSSIITLRIKENSTLKQREKTLENFYRSELKKLIPGYIEKLEPVMNVKVKEFGIKKMKTRWGTCNTRAQRIWINLELAKKPVECLEYIIIHEMTHLLEHSHNKRFFALMDRFMPHWRICKKNLSF